MSRPACEEARAALLSDMPDEIGADRVALHRQRCERCRAELDQLAALRAALGATGPDEGIDDLRRARIRAQLAPELDDLAAAAAAAAAALRRVGRWPRGTAIVAAVIAGAAAAAIAIVGIGTGVGVPSVPAPALVAVGQGADAGTLAAAVEPSLLELPAGDVRTVAIGDRAQVVLRGPARLRILERAPGRIEVALENGVAAWQIEAGERVTITAPGAAVTTDGVATVLVVNASALAKESTVSVGRGAADVRRGAATIRLATGQQWSAYAEVAEPVTEAMALPMEALLAPSAAASAASAPSAVAAADGAALAAAAAAPVSSAPASSAPNTPLHPNRNSSPEDATIRSGRGSRIDPPARGSTSVPVPSGLVEPPAVDVPVELPAGAPPEVEPPVAPMPPSADALYRDAEAAMLRGDRAAAESLLRTLIRMHGAEALADDARYELATLLRRRDATVLALEVIDELIAVTADSGYRARASELRCAILAGKHVEAYLRQHPEDGRCAR